MVTIANISIWGEYVGSVLWNEAQGYASFEYDAGFLKKKLDLSPIHLPIDAPHIFTFPALVRTSFHGLPGLLADALPDAYGRALLDRWLASQGRKEANMVERLCYQGKRGMGALEFEPSHDSLLEKSTQVEIAGLVDIAQKVLQDRELMKVSLADDEAQALLSIIRVGTSAGGARAKAVIAYNEKTKEVRSGQIDAPAGFDHWLLKLDGVTNQTLGDPMHYGRIEYIYYRMAQIAGIEMMESRLLEENGRAHFLTRRFDRVNGNEKIHMQTLCGLAHYDYQLFHAFSYEQLFQVMRGLRLPYSDAEQMYRRMVFNIIARNQDDHTKNVAFLMDRSGKWKLSPAYDVAWAYNPSGEWTQSHQLSVNGKWDQFEKNDLLSFATSMSIRKPREIIEQVTDAVSRWPELAVQSGLPQEQINAITSTHRLKIA
jgi:serine/threonine-protein kinase HipA